MPKKYRVLVTPSADEDIDAIKALIATDKPGAAAKWAGAVKRQIRSLSSFPQRGERVPEAVELPLEFRQVLMGNYRIIYRVETDSVLVMRVFHAARLLNQRLLELKRPNS